MDYNSLNNNAFEFTINRLPNTVFRLVNINLPSISIEPAAASYTPGTQYFPGSAVDFETLQMTFIVDEDLLNYEELYNWITQQKFCTDFKPKSDQEILLISDGSLVTMTNASHTNRVFYFKDLFPVDLGSLQFDSRESNPEPITCTVSFRFSYFNMNSK